MRKKETLSGYRIRFPDSLTRAAGLAASAGVCAWLVSLFILPIPVLQPVVSPPCVDLSHDFPLVDLPLADLLPVENGGRADCLFPHRGEDARHEQPGSRDYPAREPWVWHPVPRWECSAGKTRRTGSPPLFLVAFFHRKPVSFLQLAEWGTNKTVENQAKCTPLLVECVPVCYLRLFAVCFPRSAFEPPHMA